MKTPSLQIYGIEEGSEVNIYAFRQRESIQKIYGLKFPKSKKQTNKKKTGF